MLSAKYSSITHEQALRDAVEFFDNAAQDLAPTNDNEYYVMDA